ncbi:hypothetical protein QYE76_045483 [Lolium multiflorum]|uniref:CCHC-type domain-containing protein n=1 Tax=Lolium multiflorum TaxID=4521 RepID=A0AAD8TKH2_LOLMU|nr:hypothetical protein QYE76_045483 [Lolium multiflorum]
MDGRAPMAHRGGDLTSSRRPRRREQPSFRRCSFPHVNEAVAIVVVGRQVRSHLVMEAPFPHVAGLQSVIARCGSTREKIGSTRDNQVWERSGATTGSTTSSSDDEFLHTDNFFPDLSDFFDNLNMGDNDAVKGAEKFEKVDAMFKAALFSILGDNIVDPYMAFDHAKDAWDALEAKFGVSDAGTELYVMEQLKVHGAPMCGFEETKDSIGQDKILKGASSNSSSLSHGPHICLMAKGSTVPPTMEPNMSRGDKDEDEYEEEDWVVSLRDKGKSVFKVICKDKIASTHFFEILTTAIESQKLIWMHENTIDKKGALEREYADDVASLKNELEEEQTIKEALEETFALELSREKENHDRALEMANELKLKNDKLVFVNAKLLEDFEQLKKGSRVIESALAKLTESHEQLKASYLKEHANLPSSITTNIDACATNSTSCEASILKENVELRAQLELLTCNYGKLEESHGKLSRSHEDFLASHDRLKLAHEAIIFKATPYSTSSSACVVTNHVEEIKELKAQVTSLKNDLVKGHEGKCKLDTMLSMQQSPNDKSGLGFKSNNKNKSMNNNKKKGQVQVKDPAKIVCFKCNIEGHHVRSCPLKKKQKGKRPQAQTHIQPQVEEMPLPKKKQANAPIVEKPSEKKEKKRTCYICREKGHISSLCTIGTSSNSITIDDVYSLRKDEGGNVFAKFVGAQSGVKKRTIWVVKPIVTNLLGPNLVGDQQSKI